MQRHGSAIRKRNDLSSKSDRRSSSICDDDKKMMSTMSSRLRRLLTPYKLLILFIVIVFILQVIVGISFFHTVSHRFKPQAASSESKPNAPEPSKEEDPGPSQSKLSQSHNLKFSCNITAKEPLSAMNRATSTECKQSIADLVCSIQRGEVYPHTLPRYCKSKVDQTRYGEYEGCHQDSFNQRLFQGDMVKFKTDNSPEKCIQHCLETGYLFAGLQYGLECFCGNTLPADKKKKISSDSCNMECPGDPAQSCGGYLTMDIFGTGLVPLVPSKIGLSGGDIDKPVKIVYLLTIAGRASRQVRRLVKQIYSPEHYIFVHVDSRQEFMHREMEELSEKLPNLRLMTKRYSTIWGGASLLTMLLSAMKELLEMQDWKDWDFVLNLSESDYPVKTQEELVHFLSSNRENNFVKGHGREQDKFVKKQGLDKTFFECDNHMWRLGQRTLPTGVQIDGGSDWICLNRQFAQYVVYSEDELVTGLRTVFGLTLLPAESFFHTVLRNSEHCHSYLDNNLHLTNWKRKQGCKCQYKHIVDWCGCSPNDFTPEDWNKLETTRSRQIFFARKFEPIVHHSIVNSVQEWSTNITIEESDTKHSYWQNIYHHQDLKHDFDPSGLLEYFKEVVKTKSEKQLTFVKLKRLTAFSFKDSINATLALVEVNNQATGESLELEIRFRYDPRQRYNPKYQSRLTRASVGSNFDPKELIYRNYVNLLTQESKISVKLHFATNESDPERLNFIWFDPRKRLVAKNSLNFNKTSLTESATPKLNTSLEAGVWTLLATYKHDLLFTEQFLIVQSQDDPNKIAQIDPLEDEKYITNLINSENILGDDFTHLDKMTLLQSFFKVEEICFNSENPFSSNYIKCSESPWSSLFLDSKSEISRVNTTGFII